MHHFKGIQNLSNAIQATSSKTSTTSASKCQTNAPGFSQRNGGGGSHVEGMLKLI
jgi:hypothetical protein